MANAWPLTVGAALLLAACGVRDVQPAAVVIGAPARWVDVDRLPTSTRAEPLQTELPVFELRVRHFPPGRLPAEVEEQYSAQVPELAGDVPLRDRELVDVLYGERIVYSPLLPFPTSSWSFGPLSGGGCGSPWYRLWEVLEEDVLPHLERDARGHLRGVLRIHADADADWHVVEQLAWEVSGGRADVGRMEFVVRDARDGRIGGALLPIPDPSEVEFQPPRAWEAEHIADEVIWPGAPPEPGSAEWELEIREAREFAQDGEAWRRGWPARFREGGARLRPVHPGMSSDLIREALRQDRRPNEVAVIVNWLLPGDANLRRRELDVQSLVDTWDAAREVSEHVWFWP